MANPGALKPGGGSPARQGATDLDGVLSRAAARHASRLYVTDDVLDNPWDTLASYYEQEAAALTSGCAV